jgi:rhodanese-related sulfurtransferase
MEGEEMLRTVTPREAKELLDNQGYTYVDVRSEPEFAQGHAEGAVNVPIMHLDPARGMVPNPDFVDVMQANFGADAKLVLGCKSGGRSARAAETLARAGYSDLVNMDGGFDGRTDPFGGLQQAGWRQEGLPTSTDNGPGSSYTSLGERPKES